MPQIHRRFAPFRSHLIGDGGRAVDLLVYRVEMLLRTAASLPFDLLDIYVGFFMYLPWYMFYASSVSRPFGQCSCCCSYPQ